jgi:hypothetical protein
MGRIRRSGKALSVDIYERSDGRYHVVSKDETGERHSSKGSSKAMPLGEVIEKFLAAKSNRSAAYMDKLS